MPRPKKKPDYDAAQIMKDFMDTVAEAFGTYDDRTEPFPQKRTENRIKKLNKMQR